MQQVGQVLPATDSRSLTPASDAASPNALLVRRQREPRPVIMNRDTDLRIPGQLWSAWQEFGKPRQLRRALNDAERRLLAARRDELAPWIAPYHAHETDAVVLAIGEMLEGFPSLGVTEGGAAARLDSLRSFLVEQPAWAIVQACRKVRQRGYERDGKFERHWAPSDSELLTEVKREARLYRDQFDSAVNLLEAEVES